MKKLWFRFFKKTYGGNDPYFFDNKDLPWTKLVESGYTFVEREMQQIIAHGKKLQPYRFHKSASGKDEWQTLPFISWGYHFHKNKKLCQDTMVLLDSVEGLVSASLSLLEANSVIPEHRGDTNAIVRSHFGISVPAPLPECGFRVGNESRSWENGKVLPFCDAQPHSAWNHTSEKRYILILDVMRKEYREQKNKICATIISTHLLLEFDKRIKFYDKTPGWLLQIFAFPLIVLIRIALPFQQRFWLN
jgi:aspartyl/asparaginyl beta-hydroxylase (cupin superfamily)